MAETTYSYQISTLPSSGGEVNVNELKSEIQNSSITIALERIDTGYDTVSVVFKDELPLVDKGILDGDDTSQASNDPPDLGSVMGDHTAPETVVPDPTINISHAKTATDRLIVAVEKSDTSTYTSYSYNWCDQTTWYQNSVKYTDEVATTSDNQTYEVANGPIVDLTHGKITQEHLITDGNGDPYEIIVKVNDVVQTEQDPHDAHINGGTNGDYVVDYSAGTVTFHSALTGSDEVKISYYGVTDSVFTVEPNPGKQLSIEHVDVQFSSDVEMRDTTVFEIYGWVEVFAPTLWEGNGGPYPTGTKIPLKATKYKTIRNFQDDATKAYPAYPSMGGSNWRGIQNETIIMNWDYVGEIVLHSAYGMEVRTYLVHDEPFNGEYATVTLYCKSVDDPAAS